MISDLSARTALACLNPTLVRYVSRAPSPTHTRCVYSMHTYRMCCLLSSDHLSSKSVGVLFDIMAEVASLE